MADITTAITDAEKHKRYEDAQNTKRDEELFKIQRTNLEQMVGKIFVDYVGYTVQDNFPVEEGTVRRLRMNPLPIKRLMDAFKECGWTETFLVGLNKNLPVDPRLREVLSDL
jgi:hypothetical protein